MVAFSANQYKQQLMDVNECQYECQYAFGWGITSALAGILSGCWACICSGSISCDLLVWFPFLVFLSKGGGEP